MYDWMVNSSSYQGIGWIKFVRSSLTQSSNLWNGRPEYEIDRKSLFQGEESHTHRVKNIEFSLRAVLETISMIESTIIITVGPIFPLRLNYLPGQTVPVYARSIFFARSFPRPKWLPFLSLASTLQHQHYSYVSIIIIFLISLNLVFCIFFFLSTGVHTLCIVFW